MNANNIASPTTSGAAASSQPDQPKVGREAEKRYVEAIQGGAKKGLYSDEDKMGLVRLFILLGIESGNRSKVPEFKRKVVMRVSQIQNPFCSTYSCLSLLANTGCVVRSCNALTRPRSRAREPS